MPSRRQLQDLTAARLREAEALFDAGLYDGCAYICGYVLEFALKARICATLDVDIYPEDGNLGKAFKTHDFNDLRILAGMDKELTAANKSLGDNWSLAADWKPDRRYEPVGTYDRNRAAAMLDAIRQRPDGVLECISKRW